MKERGNSYGFDDDHPKRIPQLDVSEKVKSTALGHLQTWLTDPVFAEYAPQIAYLIAAGKWDVLLDSFYQMIPFGTW